MTLRQVLVGGADETKPLEAGTIEVSGPAQWPRTFAQGLVSLIGAAGLALLVPFAFLAVAIPVALAVRGVLEVAGWVMALVR